MQTSTLTTTPKLTGRRSPVTLELGTRARVGDVYFHTSRKHPASITVSSLVDSPGRYTSSGEIAPRGECLGKTTGWVAHQRGRVQVMAELEPDGALNRYQVRYLAETDEEFLAAAYAA